MKQIYAYLTLIFTLSFVVSPALTSPFSGFRADQLPVPQIDPPVQPEGYAFAIWGLIYGWLVVSAVFGIGKRKTNPAWNRARQPLIVSLAVGTPWLAVANASAVWATVLIFVMAAGAIMALLRAPQKDIWWFKVPVGIYAGWLTAASFVSLGSTSAGYAILTDAMGWAYIGILGALIVTLPVMIRTKAPSYGLTVIWALVGIIVANGTQIWTVSALATAGVVVILGLILATRTSGRKVPS
ncbi:MAG: hypothetical protein NWQ23_01785 [Yoonia sp.]|uniref:hypothetical protein n=1 Tax=Yoonia sp. TaxID=2212373 RepID=UPI00273FCE5A|nr:hypothetical protein [Yoonia sp.]MDP5084121.1 hypothetical protein [Yoonia sp.]